MSCLWRKRSKDGTGAMAPDNAKGDDHIKEFAPCDNSGSTPTKTPESGSVSTASQSGATSTSEGTFDTQDSEAIFEKFDLLEVARLGTQEGWLINPSRVSPVEEKLANGGYGAIRQAKVDGKLVACKLPHHKDLETAKNHALMRTKCICATVLGNELRIFRLLSHPNIVAWLGVTGFFFEEGGERFPELGILMEWVDGGDLKSYLLQKTRSPEGLPDLTKAKLLQDVAQGLAYLHGHFRGAADEIIVMHRDLKPHNVLVTSTDPPVAKIADFGLSVLMMQNCDVHVVAGTKQYMAPEVSSGEAYNIEADCFSFGCVCFFVLAAKHPNVATVQEDVQVLRLADGLYRVQAVAVKCLAANAKQRPSSLDIVNFLDPESIISL